MVAVLATSLCGSFFVVCRAPGGHFGTKVLFTQALAAGDPCCECLTCPLTQVGEEAPDCPSLEKGECPGFCTDYSLTGPFTHSVSRAHEMLSPGGPIVLPVFYAGLPTERPIGRVRSEIVQHRLAFLRVSVLLI
jgi:hypothetical protein